MAGNERLTAVAGAVLLALIVGELATVARLHALLSVHVFIGVLLAVPLAVKLSSTGYRFLRYYTGSPAYVRKGPPRLPLRLLAPVLVVTSLTLVGSGIGLLVTGPAHPGPLMFLHALSTLLWLPLIAIHVAAYLQRVPAAIVHEWSDPPTERTPGRGLRLGVNLGAVLAGALAAVLVRPSAAPWTAWSKASEGGIPGPFIVGIVLAVLALLATRPRRWG